MVLICYLAALLIVDHGSLADVGYILFGQASTCQFSSLIWYIVYVSICNCSQLYFEYTEAGGSTKCRNATILIFTETGAST